LFFFLNYDKIIFNLSSNLIFLYLIKIFFIFIYQLKCRLHKNEIQIKQKRYSQVLIGFLVDYKHKDEVLKQLD
jgi:hypothetical protein